MPPRPRTRLLAHHAGDEDPPPVGPFANRIRRGNFSGGAAVNDQRVRISICSPRHVSILGGEQCSEFEPIVAEAFTGFADAPGTLREPSADE
jgi:hypothetical protein